MIFGEFLEHSCVMESYFMYYLVKCCFMLSQDLGVKGIFDFQELQGKCSSCALRFDVDKEVYKSLCVILSKLPTSFVTPPPTILVFFHMNIVL